MTFDVVTIVVVVTVDVVTFVATLEEASDVVLEVEIYWVELIVSVLILTCFLHLEDMLLF